MAMLSRECKTRALVLHTLVALMVGFAVSAQAETPKANPAAEKLALESHQVLAEHCADTASDDMTVAAESVAVVSDVWARVSAELEASKKVYLLYWRGVLAQCLNQNERALIDLKKFIVERQDSTLWPDLVDDSKKRVKRLERKAEGPPRISPGWFLGGGLAAGRHRGPTRTNLNWHSNPL